MYYYLTLYKYVKYSYNLYFLKYILIFKKSFINYIFSQTFINILKYKIRIYFIMGILYIYNNLFTFHKVK